ADGDERGRQGTAHAQVDDQAFLDDLNNPLDNLLAGHRGLVVVFLVARGARIRPPLATSITRPLTGSPDSAACSMFFQASSNHARFFERIRRPSASSFVSTSASISSPSETSSAGFTERRIDSSETGITPSDLYPMSTSTSSLSTRTTVPCTTCPSLISGKVDS